MGTTHLYKVGDWVISLNGQTFMRITGLSEPPPTSTDKRYLAYDAEMYADRGTDTLDRIGDATCIRQDHVMPIDDLSTKLLCLATWVRINLQDLKQGRGTKNAD